MNILIADDDKTNRKLLAAILDAEGYAVREARDGGEALAVLQAATGPLVALIDWQMPVLTGPEVCRELRGTPTAQLCHLILVTARDSTKDIVEGLGMGAHDYVTKPFNEAELLARVRIGCEMATLQHALADRVRALEAAASEIKQLKGLLPMCSYCKSVRDDGNYWQQVERYLASNTEVKVSHGICPNCFEKQVVPQMSAIGISDAEIDSLRPKPQGERP